ncbi:MAG: hypothetical protein EON58_05640 [Alphaproteobacteria bacterium]|nr:MAG: hypothetical protein EON58_05640 [Alphaproteobacteria bacterium]
MFSRRARLGIMLVVLLAATSTASAQISADYQRGEYDQAVAVLTPLSHAGDDLATSMLGFVYAKRHRDGDDQLAIDQFRKARTFLQPSTMLPFLFCVRTDCFFPSGATLGQQSLD